MQILKWTQVCSTSHHDTLQAYVLFYNMFLAAHNLRVLLRNSLQLPETALSRTAKDPLMNCGCSCPALASADSALLVLAFVLSRLHCQRVYIELHADFT